MLLRSQSVQWRVGLVAILPLLILAQWKYGHDADSHVRMHFLSNDGKLVIYSEGRRSWLHHHSTRPFAVEEPTLVRKSPGREIRVKLPVDEYSDIQISPDGSHVATVTPIAVIAIRNVATGHLIRTRQWSIDRAEDLELHFSRDGDYLAAQAFLPKQWLLQVMETATLQVTQDIGSQWTIAGNVRQDRLIGGNADFSSTIPKLINRRFAKIEAGKLRVSHEEAPAELFEISPSGRFLICGKQDGGPGWQIVDRLSQTIRFIPLDKFAPAVFAPNEREVLVLRGDQIQRIDLADGNPLSPHRFEMERDNGYALSANGRFMAIHTCGEAIEIWDVDAGKRVQHHSSAPRRWCLWAAGVTGTITWCGAWLASARKQQTTIGTCADILVIGIVGGTGLYLRRLFAGDPDTYNRISVIGTVAMMHGLSALSSFWLVYGKGRWSWRLPVYLVGTSLLWFPPIWVWHRFNLPGSHAPISGLGMVVFAIVIMAVQRRRGYCVESLRATLHFAELGRAHQVPLRDLLAVPGAIGLFIVVAKLVELPTSLVPWLVSFGVLRCLCQALISIVAMHTALSPSCTRRRYLVGLIAITMLSVAAPLMFHRPSLWPWWYFAGIDSAIGLYVLLALLLVRRQLWRFNRRQTQEHPTTRCV